MVLLVCLGAVISFFGWYEPFAEYAGAGATVPLLGYGNILMEGIKEAVDKDGFIGLFKGGFTNYCYIILKARSTLTLVLMLYILKS